VNCAAKTFTEYLRHRTGKVINFCIKNVRFVAVFSFERRRVITAPRLTRLQRTNTTFPGKLQFSNKVMITVNMMRSRQKYSHYLPLYQTLSRTTSRAASFSKDGTRSPRGSRSGRPSSSLQSAKRRSTMNSRDAAYDEEEQLRRAIEASKGEKSGESTDGGTRRGKRGRSDSEE
jgi:hypothetical protein